MARWSSTLLLVFLLSAGRAHAEEERVAVVVSQAVGVGSLADHLGNLVAEHLERGTVQVIGPGDAARILRERGGGTPSSCGSDAACLRKLGDVLGARWVVALGVGSFGEIFSLELRAVDGKDEEGSKSISSTYAAPGPDWEQALGEALQKLVPKRLLHKRGDLMIVSEEIGAEIRVNDLAAGTIPLAKPLRLPAGSYQVEIVKDGHASAREAVEIQAGEVTELSLALMPLAGAPPPLRTYAWIASGTATAALITAIGFHVGAAGSMDEARTLQSDGKPFATERERALGRMTVSRISYGIAGAFAAGAAILFYLDHQAASPPVPQG